MSRYELTIGRESVMYHTHPHKPDHDCHCVFCKPLERPCDCSGCHGIRDKKFKITNNFFPDDKPEYCSGNMPPKGFSNRNVGSTMDMSWLWDGVILKLEVGEFHEGDFKTITRIK